MDNFDSNEQKWLCRKAVIARTSKLGGTIAQAFIWPFIMVSKGSCPLIG